MGDISSPGIGSGLDITGIINKLMDVQNKPVVLLQRQEANMQTTLSAFDLLQSYLAQFQTSLQGLNSISNYQSVSATVANNAIATATATSSAAIGVYSLQVNQLAQAQTLTAKGQVSSTTPIGTGTISFSFGSTSGTEGYANELNNLMSTVLGKTGQIASATNGINSTIKDIQSSITSRMVLNQQVLANLQAEYTALDVTLSKLNSTSSFLMQQLAALNNQFKPK